MSQRLKGLKDGAEATVRDIRRRTRKQYSAEEKIRIVVAGLRGEDSIAELCRREGIAESLYYSWSKEFLEAGKKRLAGDTARQASSGEVKDLRREMRDLKEALAEQMLENRLLKKSMTGDGGDSFKPTSTIKPGLPGCRLLNQASSGVDLLHKDRLSILTWISSTTNSPDICPQGQPGAVPARREGLQGQYSPGGPAEPSFCRLRRPIPQAFDDFRSSWGRLARGLPSVIALEAHAGSGDDGGRSPSIRRRISANSGLGTATSASWNTT